MFQLEAEKAHHLGLQGLALVQMSGLSSLLYSKVATAPVKVMGIDFPNAVGLAAGLDKNGDYIDALAAIGFGFIAVSSLMRVPSPPAKITAFISYSRLR